jgi:ADP-ribose pyrophosphatase
MSLSPVAPSRWTKLGEESLLKTRIFTVQRARYRHPNRAAEQDFVVIDAPDWVNVVAVTRDDRLVLVRQFRFGIDEFSLEVPGGIIEAGENPVAAGLRELQEETGFSGSNARLLGSVHPNPAIQSNKCHVVMVTDVAESHALQWDADEEIAVSLLPVQQVLDLVHRGGITHALVANALMLFEHEWRAGRK